MAHIGNAPFGKTIRNITSETLTSVKTAFYPTGGYTADYLDVFVNGVRQTNGVDFTATDGVLVTLQYNPTIGDTVDIISYSLIEMVNAVKRDGDTLVGTLNTQALVPTANITYDIGTSTMRYRDIYLSGNTINLGDIKLSTNGTAFSVANTTGGTFPSALANTTITGTLTVNGAVTFANSTANVVYVAANGNVGVGNNTPSAKLHVAGSITIDNNQAIRSDIGYWMIGSSSTEISIGSQSANSGRAIGLYSNSSNVPAIYCDSSSRVGLGGSPTAKLHLFGNGSFMAIDNYNAAGANGAQIRLNSEGTNWSWIYSAGVQKQALGWGNSTTPTAAALTWDFGNGGIVNMPNNPVFDAYMTGSFRTGTANLVFDSTNINVGSNYNNVTGIFTAPISGNYLFFFNANMQGQTGSPILAYIRKNGTTFGGAYNSNFGNTSWHNLAGTWAITLAKNDTVNMIMGYSDSRMDYWGAGNAMAHFGGHLIG